METDTKNPFGYRAQNWEGPKLNPLPTKERRKTLNLQFFPLSLLPLPVQEEIMEKPFSGLFRGGIDYFSLFLSKPKIFSTHGKGEILIKFGKNGKINQDFWARKAR